MRGWAVKGLAALIAILLMPSAVSAQEAQICRFETICSGTTACEPAEPDATILIRTTGDTAAITIEDKTVTARRVDTQHSDPETYFGAEPDTGGTMMVSVFADGTGIASLQGNLFGPFAVTLFGTCSAVAE